MDSKAESAFNCRGGNIPAPTRSERRVEDLITRPPFSTLFPIRQNDLESVSNSIAKHRYDPAQPIDIWNNIVLDGHTRLQAVTNQYIPVIPVTEHYFLDELGAFDYALSKQRDRRNLTPEELGGFLLRAVTTLDKLKQRGGDHKSEEAKSKPSREGIDNHHDTESATELANDLGTSRATVERVRAVIKSDDEETKQQLEEGKISVGTAYKKIKEKKLPTPTTLKKIEISLSDLSVESTRKLFELFSSYMEGSTAKIYLSDLLEVVSDIEEILKEE